MNESLETTFESLLSILLHACQHVRYRLFCFDLLLRRFFLAVEVIFLLRRIDFYQGLLDLGRLVFM